MIWHENDTYNVKLSEWPNRVVCHLHYRVLKKNDFFLVWNVACNFHLLWHFHQSLIGLLNTYQNVILRMNTNVTRVLCVIHEFVDSVPISSYVIHNVYQFFYFTSERKIKWTKLDEFTKLCEISVENNTFELPMLQCFSFYLIILQFLP